MIMKKLLLTIAFLAASLICFAQNQKVSVVELQNGTTVRGVIMDSTEEIVKIQTPDMSVFVYPKADVVRVTETNEVFRKSGLDSRGPRKGQYRGFADIEVGIRSAFFSIFTIGLETSHGIQLLEWLYMGGGMAIHTDFNSWRMPAFADVRVDIINHSITPYVDVRMGYDLMNVINKRFPLSESGFYLNPNVGCRVLVGKLPMNFSFGGNIYETASSGHCRWSLSLRAGIEF